MRLRAHYYDPTNKIETSSQPTIDTLYSSTLNQTNISSEDDRTHNKFKPKSIFDPKINDPFLEAFFVQVNEEIDNHLPRTPRANNLTKEKEAISSLQSNPNLITNKAHEGSAVVLMDTENYIKEAERQLSDTDFYVRTESDLTEKHIKQIQEILREMLDKLEIEWETFIHLKLDISKNRTVNFYFFPKIHKKEVKGRPTISGNGCPTEKISAFVDDHIKGFLKTLPSYIKDTTDFNRKLELFSNVRRTQADNELILVIMDVTSLYTNIPNHEGIVSIIKTLEPT